MREGRDPRPILALDDPLALVARLLHRHVDELRTRQGFGRLSIDPALVALAAEWADQLANLGRLQHRDLLRARTRPDLRRLTLLGENLAWLDWDGASLRDAAALIHQGWCESPTHHQNLVHAGYDVVGIAAALPDADRRRGLWVVQNFGARARHRHAR